MNLARFGSAWPTADRDGARPQRDHLLTLCPPLLSSAPCSSRSSAATRAAPAVPRPRVWRHGLPESRTSRHADTDRQTSRAWRFFDPQIEQIEEKNLTPRSLRTLRTPRKSSFCALCALSDLGVRFFILACAQSADQKTARLHEVWRSVPACRFVRDSGNP